jgi:uncharacterized protein with NAD-binding domain and iron-sulfur cluster
MDPTAGDAAQGRRRIAIIGGGCGGMAAAWGLANSPAAANLEITVYQMGWRLGGKGASGRNRERGDRIEEHGLHIWGGMYENAFAIMRQVYGQLDRPADAPLSAWYDAEHPERSAFLPHSYLTLTEFQHGTWRPWNLELPANSDLPGDGRELPSATAFLEMMVEALIEAVLGADGLWRVEQDMRRPDALPHRAGRALSRAAQPVMRGALRFLARPHLHRARAAVRALPRDPAAHAPAHRTAVHEPLTTAATRIEKLFGGWLDRHPGVARSIMILDLGAALIRGVLEDGILKHGYDVVDDEEFVAWLQRHGAAPRTLHGALVRGWHDFFFAYVNGDTSRQSLSAASALRTLFRYGFTYRGAFFWKMQAGMGDTIFAPMYEALRARGVRFEFFSRAVDIGLSGGDTALDGHDTEAAGEAPTVDTIRIVRQARLAPDVDAYKPLCTVKQLPCWPSEPIWDQLDPAQVAEIRARDIDLESWWTDWAPETYELRRGEDFDDVILAVPPPTVRNIAPALHRRSARWRGIIDGIATNQTVAAQIWMTCTLKEMGWPHPSTVGTRYASPMNTWADMDQLLVRESWERLPAAPRALVYFCGTITDAIPMRPYSDTSFPATQQARAHATAVTWLNANLGPLWGRCVLPGTDQIDWSLFLDSTDGTVGEGRFEDAYWRINIEPSERYVLSLPGTARLRPQAHESGVRNLYLAGDWLYTGINAGCVEAAVMGGLQASRALVGFPERIVGDEPARAPVGAQTPSEPGTAAGEPQIARDACSPAMTAPSTLPIS